MPSTDPRIFPLTDAAHVAGRTEQLDRAIKALGRSNYGAVRNQSAFDATEVGTGDDNGPIIAVDVAEGGLLLYYIEAEAISGSIGVTITGTTTADATLLTTTSGSYTTLALTEPRVLPTPAGAVSLRMIYPSGGPFRNRRIWATVL